MRETIEEILSEEKSMGGYTEQDTKKAQNEINSFLNKLNQLKVIEENGERPLNQLEQFLCIYEFVSNRVYEEAKTSHNITGVLNTNKAVCQGFCGLLQLLCNQVGISTIYKKCFVPEIAEDHGNIEVCIVDENGNKHCLHCDPTIDCLKKENDVLKLNATLIADKDINLYCNIQNYYDVGLYSDFLNDIEEKYFEISDNDRMFAELRGEDIEEFEKSKDENSRKKLKEMLDFFYLDESDFKIDTHSEMEGTYRKLYQQYKESSKPIENVEFLRALYNVQRAQLYYEGELSPEQIEERATEIISLRIQSSMKKQKQNWNNKQGISFMFDIVNGRFDYEQELRRISQGKTILPNEIGKATIGVSQGSKEKAQMIVSQDIKEHELREDQRRGVSIDGE